MKLASFTGWRSGTTEAIRRFPLNILCAAVAAVCLIVDLHTKNNDWLAGQATRLAMAAALGLPLFFSLRLMRERTARWSRWPIELFGIVLLALWTWFQPARPGNAPGIFMIRWLLLLAALH